jgi:hypothetical protein
MAAYPSPVARRGSVIVEGSAANPGVFRFAARLPGYKKFLDDGGLLFQATKHHIDLWKQIFPDWPITDADGTIANLYQEVAPVQKA